MRKVVGSFILSILLISLCSLPILGENRINTIDIEAILYDDGSMKFTQVWNGYFDEGTENYISMKAPEYLTISELKVSDENGAFDTVENWDINANFEEKSNKCGINYTSEGYEICFGISEYGSKRYVIEYKLDNVVASYEDMDGVNFRFVNKGMNTTPTDVNINIRLENGKDINDENCDVWGFGYAGQVEFLNGMIKAYTETPITEENHVTVMFAFQKGILNPSRVEEVSFETTKENAFSGSDYDYEEEISVIGGILTATFAIVIVGGILVAHRILEQRVKRKKMDKLSNRFGYFREVPNEGNVSATYVLGKLFEICEDGAILGTSILRLIDLGCLISIKQEEVGVTGKVKETITLKLRGSNHCEMNEYDEYLYTVLEGAAGKDGILQKKELAKFVNKNDRLLRNYIEKCDKSGRAYLSQNSCLKRWDSPSKLKYLTDNGEKELGELLGFKKYLEDFSLVAEREVKEMPIWRELLSYAMLFGIADKVEEQMKELYPEVTMEMGEYSQSISIASSYYISMYRNMREAEERREQESRSSGSGGSSSINGGGGAIGGGSDGGSR